MKDEHRRARRLNNRLLSPYDRCQTNHQFSHTALGITVLMTFQCPIALCLCHASNCFVLPILSTSPCSSKFSAVMASSCWGTRKALRAPLPRKSASMGFRNVIGELGVFLQKMTTLVKSVSVDIVESDLEIRGSRGSSSRKMRQEGKTARMVRTTWDAAGSARSPA